MSEQSMGEGWWQASDGKWYAPDQHPDPGYRARFAGATTATPSTSTSATSPGGGDGGPAAASADSTASDDDGGEPDGAAVTETGQLHIGPADDADRYQLKEHRSRGNDGDLWLAALGLDDVEVPVALKVSIRGTSADLDQARERWLRQAELLRSLEHPALVKVREVFEAAEPHRPGDAGSDVDVVCLVMNWVDGKRLDDWVKDHPDRSLDDVVALLEPMADALDYLHAGIGGRPVLHRNLKPGNVLVTADGSVRLVGFGTARLMKLDANMTIVGTPAWMPPEILNGESYDAAADRWAFGAIACYLLCGSPPPLLNPEKTRSLLAEAPLLTGRSDLVDLVMAMLDPEPNRRPERVGSWMAEVDAAVTAGAQPEDEPTGDATDEPTDEPAEGPDEDVAPATAATGATADRGATPAPGVTAVVTSPPTAPGAAAPPSGPPPGAPPTPPVKPTPVAAPASDQGWQLPPDPRAPSEPAARTGDAPGAAPPPAAPPPTPAAAPPPTPAAAPPPTPAAAPPPTPAAAPPPTPAAAPPPGPPGPPGAPPSMPPAGPPPTGPGVTPPPGAPPLPPPAPGTPPRAPAVAPPPGAPPLPPPAPGMVPGGPGVPPGPAPAAAGAPAGRKGHAGLWIVLLVVIIAVAAAVIYLLVR